jgi:very-short-patch-repair endonuclease
VIRGDVHVTLSELERAFLELLRQAGLPLPITNKLAGGRRVDCHWPDYNLTVELDSYQFHNSRYAWEQDRAREKEARKRKDRFRRFTYGDITEDPDYVIQELRALLSPGAPQPRR